MIKKYLFLIFSFIKYYYLRLKNSLIVRIRENIFLYPFEFILPSFKYSIKLDKVKLYNLNKEFFKDYFSESMIIDNGLVRAKIQKNWLFKSNDEEISYSPRRLFWLIYELTKENNPNIQLISNQLNKFIDYFYSSFSINDFPPYILSECISNMHLFNRAKNKSWIIQDQKQRNFILKANKLLIKNIEFRGPFSTCNHILNNFRALYLSSKLIKNNNGDKFFIDFWLQVKNIVFIHNGKIGDGSVHYHFLITRWLFEICICAYEINDYVILNEVNPYLKVNLEIIENLSRANSLPLFGDLSPDCPVEWLLPISNYVKESFPYSCVGKVKKGWDRIWSFDDL